MSYDAALRTPMPVLELGLDCRERARHRDQQRLGALLGVKVPEPGFPFAETAEQVAARRRRVREGFKAQLGRAAKPGASET